MPSLDNASLIAAMPFAQAAGVQLDRADKEAVQGSLDWAPEHCTVGGVLHGAALMTLADSLGAVCAFLHLPEGAATSTIESKTNLLRAVRDGTVRGTARAVHVGRTTIVVQTEVRDPRDRLVALTTQTQAVLT